jgi:hypothetical protein
MQSIYSEFLISFDFDFRSIRSKDALCTQVDERACLVSRGPRHELLDIGQYRSPHTILQNSMCA